MSKQSSFNLIKNETVKRLFDGLSEEDLTLLIQSIKTFKESKKELSENAVGKKSVSEKEEETEKELSKELVEGTNIFDIVSSEASGHESAEESLDSVEELPGDMTSNIFDNIVKDKKTLFKNGEALTLRYFPEKIVHRDEEILQLASVLSPILDQRKPSNLLVYGKPGTGKTVCVKFVCEQLKKKAEENDIPMDIVFLNCKIGKSADTEYRLFAELARNFGEKVPATGLPTQEVYDIFCRSIDSNKRKVILVLDEIDNLVKKDGKKSELMYSLTRINSDKLQNSEISFIGISNDTTFIQYLDPRTKSSLGEEEFVFSPYNADQLKDLLTERANISFFDGVVKEPVISKCAAYAARENGDARKALELLRVSAELAERERSSSVREAHVDMAQEKIERDNVATLIEKQPKQSQIVLFSIIKLLEVESPVESSNIYDMYGQIANKVGLKPLTSRRVSDLIAELDLMGIINTKILYRGRGGRTRQISLAIPSDSLLKVNNILKEVLEL